MLAVVSKNNPFQKSLELKTVPVTIMLAWILLRTPQILIQNILQALANVYFALLKSNGIKKEFLCGEQLFTVRTDYQICSICVLKATEYRVKVSRLR